MLPQKFVKSPIFVTLDGKGGALVKIRADVILSITDRGTHRDIECRPEGKQHHTFHVRNSVEDIEKKIRATAKNTAFLKEVFVPMSWFSEERQPETKISANRIYSMVGPEGGEPDTVVYVSHNDHPLRTKKTLEEIEQLVTTTPLKKTLAQHRAPRNFP